MLFEVEFADAKNINSAWIRKVMTVVGLRIYFELNGNSCLAIENVVKKKKNIMVSQGFGNSKVKNHDTILHALTNYVFMNADNLRAQNSKAKKLYVFLEKTPVTRKMLGVISK